jgi:L,D-peptidoglycan transpeptidase YkuD (ErfK/YbiS/YcfS/YnhG family)
MGPDLAKLGGLSDMIFTAWSDGRFEIAGRWTRCALGRAGLVAAADKREGDGATPAGLWPMRRLLYRSDNVRPPTGLPATPIGRDDGWCDDPDDRMYNRPVGLPYQGRSERLWRDDHLYDLVVVLGHNDAPPVAGAGSCIFLHLARTDYGPTEGCVALARPDLEAVLGLAGPGAMLRVARAEAGGITSPPTAA